ncbi:UvrD-helicase domain-containing protein [[Flexibacter] sp. ATCC 35208]|uniref:UvrD-helicase domain-containing protein n=1 Tax=[Flexibacter] sp. ATCC 35208 TaxID=1936242 RepID=UPI0009D09802|nr:UvrD-helicase domain-containing protein [[Flexibacter] sp. ATCC 35208]OMP74729.1 hypothetical protein BW716_33850 [[Flexibacter] sp. ATCC 35208]
MLQINLSDIAYAENILFSRTGVFDAQRIAYIQEMNTCDLQAVPGSGKTTALLAKLLIIERHLPLVGSRAVLVLSHTNAAVEEIKHSIGMHCPKLFSGNHFVGTIQAFVDQFLAFPYYQQKFNKKPLRIDDDLYKEKAHQFSSFSFAGFGQIQNMAKQFLRGRDRPTSIRFTGTLSQPQVASDIAGTQINITNPQIRNGRQDWTQAEKDSVQRWLLSFKKKLLRDGYLCFDDAYFLANSYLSEFPAILQILQTRFQYIFVDEMQDMAAHQFQLLETLFGIPIAGATVYQRIGDKNQAIYSDVSRQITAWIDRPRVLQITGSHRLCPNIAAVVQRLAASPIAVVGLKQNADGSPIRHLPHLLVYNDLTAQQVIPHYATLLQQYRANGTLPGSNTDVYKAICWRTQDEQNRVTIRTFFPNYNNGHKKIRITHDIMENYLYMFDTNSKSVYSVGKNLLNALLQVLRIESVSNPAGFSFSKNELYEYLKDMFPTLYNELRESIFIWSSEILKGNQTAVLAAMKLFIPRLLVVFNKHVSSSRNFINNTTAIRVQPANVNQINQGNWFKTQDFSIEVATVHSVKGQTHTATLYMESYYQKSVRNSGCYESERLSHFILGHPSLAPHQIYLKQSLRMAYVGFSRPTHLLCFAVHIDRFNTRLNALSPNDWHIIHI